MLEKVGDLVPWLSQRQRGPGVGLKRKRGGLLGAACLAPPALTQLLGWPGIFPTPTFRSFALTLRCECPGLCAVECLVPVHASHARWVRSHLATPSCCAVSGGSNKCFHDCMSLTVSRCPGPSSEMQKLREEEDGGSHQGTLCSLARPGIPRWSGLP